MGSAPDTRSIDVARKNGIDISNLKGRQITSEDLDTFDYIYVMDQNNLEDVLKMATTDKQKRKVKMILDTIFPAEKVDVPDPYHGSSEDFKKVFEMLDAASEKIAKQLD